MTEEIKTAAIPAAIPVLIWIVAICVARSTPIKPRYVRLVFGVFALGLLLIFFNSIVAYTGEASPYAIFSYVISNLVMLCVFVYAVEPGRFLYGLVRSDDN